MRTTRTCTTTTRASAGAGASTGAGAAGSLVTAQQQLASAQAALAATRLIAPQGGVVAAVNLTVGTLPGTPAIELRGTTLSVQVPVAEQDAPYVRPGQPVQLGFTALGTTGLGTVAAAPLEPAAAPSGAGAGAGNVVSYPVTVTIGRPPPGLLVGMNVQATWTAATRADVLAVPTTAIQGGGSNYVVRVLSGGTPSARRVTLGLSTPSLTEITGGLRPGDLVVTGVN